MIFARWKVITRVAFITVASAEILPSDGNPLGTSIEITFLCKLFIWSISSFNFPSTALFNPDPSNASIITSDVSSVGRTISDNSVTRIPVSFKRSRFALKSCVDLSENLPIFTLIFL